MENEQNEELAWYWYFIGSYLAFLFLNWQMTLVFTGFILAWIINIFIWILPLIIIGLITGYVIKKKSN